MLIRTILPLAAAAATLSLASCEEAALPISQTIDGVEYSYTIPAGTTADEVYAYEQTVEVQDVQAELANYGFDNVILEAVEIERLDLTIHNDPSLSPGDEGFLSFADIESLDVSFDELDADNEMTASVALASLEPGTYAITDVAASLGVLTGVNVLRFLEQEEVTVRADIRFKDGVELIKDVNVDVEMDYSVKAKVAAGQ